MDTAKIAEHARQYAAAYEAAYSACFEALVQESHGGAIGRTGADRAGTWFAGRIMDATLDKDALAALAVAPEPAEEEADG